MKPKFLGYTLIGFSILHSAIALLVNFSVKPQMLRIYEQIDVEPNLSIFYISLFVVLATAISGIFVGIKLTGKNNQRFIKAGKILLALSFILLILNIYVNVVSMVSPIYGLTSQL